MRLIALCCIAFGVSTAASVTLLGDRGLLGTGSWTAKQVLALLVNWRFISSMALALVARASFVATNVAVLRNERLAPAATTITTFFTASAYFFIVLSNWLFLGERLTGNQLLGASVIMVGIVLMTR